MVRVFLSYSRQDRSVAELLSERLRRHGVDAWWDVQLRPGDDWQSEITTVLQEAAAVIVVVTPNSLASDLVAEQWSTALRSSKRVIPALARGARGIDLPAGLANLQAVDLDEDFERGVAHIARAVSQLERSAEPPPTEYVDFRAVVEDVVEKKLASLGVDRDGASDARDQEDRSMVFVVTSFQPDMEPAFEAIHAAARSVGLHAERVKDVPGDYRITDRILSSIRRAGLVIVDLTHERPNVYFELGFARGLGKTVITIMHEGTTPHFDVQDWTYLTYVDSRPLERDLLERFKYEMEKRTGRANA